MTFNDVYSLFTPATKDNFPVHLCTIETTNEHDPGVFYSDKFYLCLVIDKRFTNEMVIRLLAPYIWKGDIGEGRGEETNYAWVTETKNQYFDNAENPIHYDDDYVIAFTEYNDTDEHNNMFWDNIISKIESID